MTSRQASRVAGWWLVTCLVLVALCVWADRAAWPSEPTPQAWRAATPDLRNAWQRWCATVDRARLAPWERQWLGRTPLRVATVFVTNYGLWEGYHGASWHIAANPAHLKPGTVVWLEKDRALKVVTNRGASSKDAWARREGAEFWIDRWTQTRRGDNATQRAWVIGRAPWRH